MASGDREKARRCKVVPIGVAGKKRRAKTSEERNDLRRRKYATDPGYARKQKENARRYYRKSFPLQPTGLSSGPMIRGQLREVIGQGIELPCTVESFTIPEAAEALGRTPVTLKKWIRDGMLPAPVLEDTVRHHRVYSIGEITAIARALAEHERWYSYYGASHHHTRITIEQQIFGYRQHNI